MLTFALAVFFAFQYSEQAEKALKSETIAKASLDSIKNMRGTLSLQRENEFYNLKSKAESNIDLGACPTQQLKTMLVIAQVHPDSLAMKRQIEKLDSTAQQKRLCPSN
jgi:hypothetical protein